MKKGRLILIVGTSGAGKSVLANEIIRKGAILNEEESMPSNCIQGDEDYYDGCFDGYIEDLQDKHMGVCWKGEQYKRAEENCDLEETEPIYIYCE